MADLKKQATDAAQKAIVSGIVEVFKWGWKLWGSAAIALFFTGWAYVKGQPAWVLGLIAVGAFFVIVATLHLLMRLFADNKNANAEPAPHPQHQQGSNRVYANQQPHIEVNPIFNLNPVLAQNNTQQPTHQQSQQQSQRQVQSESTPEIEMRQFVQKTIAVNDTHMLVLAIPFRNNSEMGAINVVAQISFENTETHHSQDVNYGFWIESDEKRAVLGIGTTNHIALVGVGISQAVTLDGKSTRRYVGAYCQTRYLENGIWRVKVNLVGDRFRQSYPLFKVDVSDNGVYRLRESEEVQPALKEQRLIQKAELIKALNDFAKEGGLLLDNGSGMNSDWPKANDWAARAETYIRANISEDSAEWFSLAVTEAWPRLAVDRDYVDWIYTRVKRLGELASEVRKH